MRKIPMKVAVMATKSGEIRTPVKVPLIIRLMIPLMTRPMIRPMILPMIPLEAIVPPKRVSKTKRSVTNHRSWKRNNQETTLSTKKQPDPLQESHER